MVEKSVTIQRRIRGKWKVLILLGLGLVLGACGDGTPAASSPDVTPTVPQPASATTTIDASAVASALEGGESAIATLGRDGWSGSPTPLIDEAEVGVVLPPDGIPSIDDPQFVDIATADSYLEDAEPVVYLDIDGDARAYPVQILIWHEIVNDVVGGEPVAITYCPLCNSAVTYRRVIGDETVTFGTSGALYNSALVMYDRTTESLWTHYDGRAVIGALTGYELEPISAPLLSWADFKAQFPDGVVLDRERTGARRDYGSNPYGGYDSVGSTPFLFRGDADARAELLRRVVGVSVGDTARAWTLDSLMNGEASVTVGAIGEKDLIIFWKAGQASALDSSTISEGFEVGSVGVFEPTIDGRALTFAAEGSTFVDVETGSQWSITGRAIEGELEGQQLVPVPHLDTFWFSWSSYQGETDLIGG